MGGHCPVSLLRIIVGDDQLRELAPIVVPLLDVVDAGGFHQKNSRLVVQPPHKSIVVVGQQELSLDGEEGVPQTDVICFGESILTDVLVIPLCGMVSADAGPVLPVLLQIHLWFLSLALLQTLCQIRDGVFNLCS